MPGTEHHYFQICDDEGRGVGMGVRFTNGGGQFEVAYDLDEVLAAGEAIGVASHQLRTILTMLAEIRDQDGIDQATADAIIAKHLAGMVAALNALFDTL